MTIQVGLIGTGFAAKKRADYLNTDPRASLVTVASNDLLRANAFAQNYQIQGTESWHTLIHNPNIELVIVATVNANHGDIVEAALKAHKHVVVEYPLSLDLQQATALVQRAQKQQCLLHVEHIERLGGLHRATKAHLPDIGQPSYVNYRTINPKHPAPQKWSYNLNQAGFPFMSALSRVHRLTDLLGPVRQVYCHSQFQPRHRDQYQACLCSAQITFENDTLAEVTYGKGENLWTDSRRMELQGDQGSLIFDRDQGLLTTDQGQTAIKVEPRRGLFDQDTQQVLDYLTTDKPLYITPQESLYALKVADALRRSSESGKPITLTADQP